MKILLLLRHLQMTFIRCEKGATAIEYALIAGMISIAILGGIQSLSGGLSSMYDSISAVIE